MSSPELPDYAVRNRTYWSAGQSYFAEAGRRNWASEEIRWGIFGNPESEVRALPELTGIDAIELGLHRLDWSEAEGEGTDFQLGHGEWIDLLRANDFEIERLLELFAPADATTHPHWDYVSAEWAQKWPAEEIWVARKL